MENQKQGTYDNAWKESENKNLWSVTLIFYIQTSTPLTPKKMYDLAKLWKELTNKIALYYSNSCCENAWLCETIVAVKIILVQITKC